MDPNEIVVLCGEWETGPTPQQYSYEKYNLDLEVVEIIRHPAFDASELGVEGGSDLAIFKIKEESSAALQDHSSAFEKNEINPICLPDPVSSNAKEAVNSGWANPPPLYFFDQFGSGFLPFLRDTFKQWHYKMKIEDDCREPRKLESNGLDITYPSVSYYPPGLICAKDITGQFCPTAGDSGSPLMVKNSQGQYSIQGVLSFHKGCEEFYIGARNNEKTKFEFHSHTESPLAYTKLSCFLPWVAEQFGLSYDDRSAGDEACLKGTGQKPPFNSTHKYDAVCRETKGANKGHIERPCIFPFYYKGEGPFHSCTLVQRSNFVVPVWRCPTYNITTKFRGTDINNFEDDLDEVTSICLDEKTCDGAGGPGCIQQLDPAITDCPYSLRRIPFAPCKSDCPGGKNLLSDSMISICNLASLQ